MKIEEYQEPTADSFAPRSRAEQQAARAVAKARAQLGPDPDAPARVRREISRQQVLLAITAGAIIILATIGMAYQLSGDRLRPLQVTPQAVEQGVETRLFTSPTEAPQAEQPTQETVPEEVMINVYGSPNGGIIGPIEISRQITPVAHYGSDWVQAEVEGSGLVWIRVADLPRLVISGPDLAPRAVPPMTGRGLGVVEPQAPVPPTYIEVVAEQASHCVRDCDGQPGLAGGDWVAVPTLAPAQAEIIRQQAEHKVR